VAEHALGDAVRLRCVSQGSPEIQLLKSRF
jgi:hypothetical protein